MTKVKLSSRRACFSDGQQPADQTRQTAPDISLIVCTIGRPKALERLFGSFILQQYSDFEVVLVDQSPPGTLDDLVYKYSTQLRTQHLRSERGLSRARNLGLRHARGSLLGFPDDDCWYRPETLAQLTELWRSIPEFGIIVGRTVDCDGKDAAGVFSTVACDVNRHNYLNCGNSAALFVRRDSWRQIGGFDERLGLGANTPFQSGEESDFLLRGMNVGIRIRYLPELQILHDQIDDVSLPQAVRRALTYGAGHGALLRKHGFRLSEVIYRFLRPLSGAVFALLQLNWRLARMRWSRLRGLVEGYRRWRTE